MQKNIVIFAAAFALAASSQLFSMEQNHPPVHPEYLIDNTIPMFHKIQAVIKNMETVPVYVKSALGKALSTHNLFTNHFGKKNRTQIPAHLHKKLNFSLRKMDQAIQNLESEKIQLETIHNDACFESCLTLSHLCYGETFFTDISYATHWQYFFEQASITYDNGIKNMKLIKTLLEHLNESTSAYLPHKKKLATRTVHWNEFPIEKKIQQRLNVAYLLEWYGYLSSAKNYLTQTRKMLTYAVTKVMSDKKKANYNSIILNALSRKYSNLWIKVNRQVRRLKTLIPKQSQAL